MATYLLNHLPTLHLNSVTPFERLFSKTPYYSILHKFGCACYPFLNPFNKHKLNYWTRLCVFLGISILHHGYILISPLVKFSSPLSWCLMTVFFLSLPILLCLSPPHLVYFPLLFIYYLYPLRLPCYKCPIILLHVSCLNLLILQVWDLLPLFRPPLLLRHLQVKYQVSTPSTPLHNANPMITYVKN